jgi:hypothetical protein
MAAAAVAKPSTLQFRRPYLPRRYGSPYGQQAAGGGINVGQIGKGITDLVAAIQKGRAQEQLQQQQQQQNAIANRLLNTSNPLLGTVAPRAALVAPGVNPATGAANALRAGVPTTGTAPITGGLNEIAVRQQLINQAIEESKLRNALSGGGGGGGGAGARGPLGPAAGSRSGWARQGAGGGGGRGRAVATGGGGTRATATGGAGAGKAGAVDTNAPQNPAQYNFNTLSNQFDTQQGRKGAYAEISPFLNNVHPAYDPKDPNQTPPDTGLWMNAKGGLDYYQDGKLKTSMMGNDADYWLQRFNTARSNAGMDPIHTPLQGGGTPDNPYVLNSPWDYGSVPYNQYFTTTDNPKVGQKLRPEDAPKMAAAQIALGGRGGGGEDYLSSWRGAMGGQTTGPDLPAPTPLAPETGGSGYGASFGGQGLAPDTGTEFGPSPNDQAYASRFNPPIPSTVPDDQAYAARYNPPTLPGTDEQAQTARFNPPTPAPSSITPDDQAYSARFNPPVPPAAAPMNTLTNESVVAPPPDVASPSSDINSQLNSYLLMGGT